MLISTSSYNMTFGDLCSARNWEAREGVTKVISLVRNVKVTRVTCAFSITGIKLNHFLNLSTCWLYTSTKIYTILGGTLLKMLVGYSIVLTSVSVQSMPFAKFGPSHCVGCCFVRVNICDVWGIC